MKPYTIIITYDGTNYHGWQEQKNVSTIAGTLQKTFKKVFGHDIKTVGSSRTDKGVHSDGQVARFYTNRTIELHKMLRSWNGALPLDINIKKIIKNDEIFHPQHNVKHKIYEYNFTNERPHPFLSRYTYYYSYKIDIDKFKKCLNLFIGTHDFFNFYTKSKTSEVKSICTLNSIELSFNKSNGVYTVTINGNRFLHHMIRRIIGSAIAISSSKNRSVDEINYALKNKKITYQLPTAPGKGLVLKKIIYEGYDNE